jgi:hypothetical protein
MEESTRINVKELMQNIARAVKSYNKAKYIHITQKTLLYKCNV